jgi:hypothetical protein
VVHRYECDAATTRAIDAPQQAQAAEVRDGRIALLLGLTPILVAVA